MNHSIFPQGTFGYDLQFLKQHNIEPVILKDNSSAAQIIVIPAWQGRVLTSTANNAEGFSYGWINYKLIESGKNALHINAFGGEERLWLGPEGGQFSFYFKKGTKQIFDNWFVPKEFDTESFEIVSQNSREISLKKQVRLINYSGNSFDIKIERNIKILSASEAEDFASIKPGSSIKSVSYESENKLTNTGENPWVKQNGLMSIWMLSMMVPSPDVVIFAPFKSGNDKDLGKVVNSDYFGEIPENRLKVSNGFIFLKADGKFRSKIGLSPLRTKGIVASYDAKNSALTILSCRLPEHPAEYVNSKWEIQKDPYSGDVMNAYNDGPLEDGSQMGPFYEIESSSPAAQLEPGKSITHLQRIYHFEGNEKELDEITQKLLGTNIQTIKSVF